MKDATINKTTCLHKGRVFTLYRENITIAKGATFDLDVIRHPGASAIVPLKDHKSLVMIRQYRHAIGGYIWEIPAGTLDPNEDPLTCAQRELVEEIGFSAEQWDKLGEIVPVPGYSDERIHLFLASNLIPKSQNLGKDEMLDVHEIPISQVMEMIASGEIVDGKTITGIFLAVQWLNKEKAA